MDEAQTKSLSDFVRLYVSLTEGEEPQEGYFRLLVGPTHSGAKRKGDRIDWKSFKVTYPAVERRVKALLKERIGHVYVEAMYRGETHYQDYVRVDGESDEAEEDVLKGMDVDAKGAGAASIIATQANVTVIKLLAAQLQRRDEHIMGLYEQRQMMGEKLAITGTVAAIAEANPPGGSGVAEALQALGPIIAPLVPVALQWFAQQQQQRRKPPTTEPAEEPEEELPPEPRSPQEELDGGFGEILAIVARLGPVLGANPALQADPAVREPLRQVVLRLGPLLGLQVSE